MPTLYEHYITDDDNQTFFYGALAWRAQTFTPATAHTITSVKLKLYRFGSPGDITISIQGVDGGGHPDGSELCGGTTSGDTLTDSTPGEWREITLGAGAKLSASTKYAIVVKVLSGDAANNLRWRMDLSSPTYDGGNYEETGDGGSSWTAFTARDFMFEDWGEPTPTAKPYIPHCGPRKKRVEFFPTLRLGG